MSGWPRRGWRREVPEPAASWGRRPCHRPRGHCRGRGLERRIGEGSGAPARPGALHGEAPPGERSVQGRCDDDRATRLDPRASPTRARANAARRQLWPPRSGRCRSAARPERGVPQHVVPVGMGREARDDRQVPEQLAPVDEDPIGDRCQHAIPYRRVLVPSLTSSSSSWSNASGPQPVDPDATAASSTSFDG
jgi:hypothetical protein